MNVYTKKITNSVEWLFDYIVRPLPIRGKFRILDRVFPKSGVYNSKVFGFEMQLDLNDLVQRGIFFGSYEFNETRWIQAILRPGDTAVDVGANCGYYTALFAKQVGNQGRVISFEPNPYFRLHLEQLKSRNNLSQLELCFAGASDTCGSLDLYVPPRSETGLSNEDGTLSVVDGWVARKVDLVRVKDKLSSLSIDRVRLLKADIEGHEMKMLTGAGVYLTEGKVDYLLLEFHDYWLRRQGSSASELFELCQGAGYELVRGSQPLDGQAVTLLLKHRSA